MSNLRAYILCRFADSSGIYSSWIDDIGIPAKVIDEFLPDWQVPDDAGILITHMHYRWEELTTLRTALQNGQVPILILSDGILEYRNTWEHPNLVDGSIFQPLFGHKLACIGRGQARIVESWGNAGRCEVVGLPRFDDFDSRAVPPVSESGPFRVLIATANTPAFTDLQRATVRRSLEAIRQWVHSNSIVKGRELKVTWRLSDGFETELGVGSDVSAEDRPPIAEVIAGVDAVITTPSTLILESVLWGRPTAILDFQASPQYVPAAWTISSPNHLDTVMPELAQPPKHKMGFQEFVLHDQLECRTPAKPRMLELVRQMIAAGEKARATRSPIELPARVLVDPQQGFNSVPENFDPATLFLDNSRIQDPETGRLQVELAAAIKRLEQLPFEVADKNQMIAKLTRSLDRSRDRVEEMHNRVVAIRKRFGVKPEESKEERG